MNEAAKKPQLRATVFSDYVCPFCYVGDVRLNRLRADYDLRVNWCFVEIHPETPPDGQPVETLGYAPEQWTRMMAALKTLAGEEGLRLVPPIRVANSHRALLLAEAAKEEGAERFYRLHRRLFEAYLSEGENIADPTVLERLAEEAALPPGFTASAWREPRFEKRLVHNRAAARELAITATPTIFIGERRLTGAVAAEEFREAARMARPDH
ncbi:MAG: DsbA family protein [Gammaproteobacteria bacterium]